MVEAIREERPHRASGLLGAHVVEVVRGILQSAAEGRTVEIESRVTQPAAMPSADAARS
jgi:predicted dehydrogenase